MVVSCNTNYFNCKFCFVIFLKRHNWLSNFFLSIGSSAFTGAVLYYLSNMRGNKIQKTQSEINRLQKLGNSVNSVILFSSFFSVENTNNTEKKFDIFESLMRELNEASSELPESAFIALGFDIDDPFDRDKIKYYIDRFQGSEKSRVLEEIVTEFRPIYKKILNLIHNKEIQISFSNNSVL
ncbi:MAG: hypothetical protein IJL26_05335 [Clostridia bacterium]|nr:hypothetical protein [Clostridia bacterium]